MENDSLSINLFINQNFHVIFFFFNIKWDIYTSTFYIERYWISVVLIIKK